MKVCIRFLAVIAVLSTCILFGGSRTEAYLWLMDGKLEVNGMYKEQLYIRTHIPRNETKFHKSNLDYWRSVFLIEGLYHVYEGDDFYVNLFGGFRYFYEKAPALDSELKRGIPHRPYSEYTHPRDDDLITELYLDIQKGPWQFKIGKQIVVWGETNLQQTADIINPLDIRHGSPGTENWEEIKIGLWMIRGFYQSDLPGQLSFEFIFNPGDYEPARIPIEGTHYSVSRASTSFNPDRGYGITHWLWEKARRDAPGWNLRKNWEVGLKVRGYTWNVDWSFFYFNTISDEPVANPNRINQYSLEYVQSGLRSMITGSHIRPRDVGYKVFKYKRFQVVGATFQTRFEKTLFSEWRLEMFYEIGAPFNKTSDGTSGGDYISEVRRDTFGFGLEARDYFTIPYFTHNWFQDKKMSISITLFYEKMFNHDRGVSIRTGRGHRPSDSHATTIAFSISQYWFHSKWFTMITGSWNPIGKYFFAPILGYAPGKHWRFEGGVPIYGSSAGKNMGLHDKDSILIRVRYEF